MIPDLQELLTKLNAASDDLLGNQKGLVLNAMDPERRIRLEAQIQSIRGYIQPMRITLGKLERVERMVAKALRKHKPRIRA